MIALVDCNNFFASCERLFRPDLKSTPVLVLSSNDGCVVARSNEVKELGIPMGIPYFKVREVVNQNGVQCFSSNFALYSNISQRILGVLRRHIPHVEVYSIDEAFLDLSTLKHIDFKKWGDRLREEVRKDIGMPVSVGIAPTKTLAKLASTYAKLHQQTCVVDPNYNKEFYETVLAKIKVENVWGIGWRLAPRMKSAGIRTALDLARVSEHWIHAQMGVGGTKLLNELRGMVMHPFEDAPTPQKTLVASRSFGHTVRNTHDLESAVSNFASQAAHRLRLHTRVTSFFGVYLRFKTKDGQLKGQSAATHISTPTNNTVELVQTALQLMYQLYDPENSYKKAGVFASNLSSANTSQLDLFAQRSPAQKERQNSLMHALDEINYRYGTDTIHISTIDPKSTKWHAFKKRMSPAYTTDWNQLPLLYALSP